MTQANRKAMVSFNAASYQNCPVECRAQAAGGAWLKLAEVVACRSDWLESATDRNAGDDARFYRVMTPRQP